MSSKEGTATWKITQLPNFNGAKVHVLPGAFYGAIVGLMAEAGWVRSVTIDEADLVVFGGGADISPELYGQEPLPQTYFDEDRDTHEIWAYNKCVTSKIPMFGICRGAQFLHAMNGGKLWQDVS